MSWPTVVKALPPPVRPNMVDYDETRATFSWDRARELVSSPPAGGINMCYQALDRHCAEGRGDRVAIHWLARNGDRRLLRYRELADATSRFANVLRELGVGPGEVVFGLASRIPELYIAVLGTLRARSVFAPLFSAFGPEPIASRVAIGRGKVLLTTAALYRRKIAPYRDALPSIEHYLVVGDGQPLEDPGVHEIGELLARASSSFDIEHTDPEELALLHFTSGTTGKPKGAMHVHQAIVAHHITGLLALDLHPDDVFWCTADPGWVTGTSYGILAPLSCGVSSIVDEAEYDAKRWYRILSEEKVNVWYTAPTAVRMLMRSGAELAKEVDLSALRFLASVGEPLNPEAVLWGRDTFGVPYHDNWWQSETGGIMIANFACMDVKPGSMGRPMPGIEAGLVEVAGDEVKELHEEGAVGQLALRPGWPSMFRGYLGEEERYRRCFAGGWYLTGDLARRDAEGYYWFVGRADDVIKSSGHLISPFEVESALLEHEAVAEAAVIGIPHPVAGNVVHAYVSLAQGYDASDELSLELKGFARKRLGPALAPREIVITDQLPRTRSGKIMRRLLRARVLGLPEGDTSTLESSRD